YALRLVSDVLSSNGSTSMASVCGSTLSMMDAGVPLRSEERRVGKECRCSRDWSSDVCSSDLVRATPGLGRAELERLDIHGVGLWLDAVDDGRGRAAQIGRASCRERV